MTTMIGTAQLSPESVQLLKATGNPDPARRWAAYENHDLSSPRLGELRFMAIGPNNTLQAPPERYPDSHLGTGWAYLFVGFVNLETGTIDPSC